MSLPYLENPESEPIRHRDRKVRSLRRWIVAAFWSALALVVVLSLTFVGSLVNSNRNDSNVAPATADSPGKPVAVDTMTRWLAADPQPLPGGQLLSWDRVEIVPRPDIPSGSSDSEAARYPHYDLETHYFTVSDKQGALYTATVTVRTNPELGSVVVGTPTATRNPPSVDEGGDWGNTDTWVGYQSVQVEDVVTEATVDWADAYTSGDPRTLRRVVGDPEAGHSYMPIGAAQPGSTEVRVVAAAAKTPEQDEPVDRSRLLVRVELTAQFEPADSDDNRQQRRPAFTYDLLVVAADTATPRVVAWGAAGEGPKLTEYANAVTGRELAPEEPQAPQTQEPSTAETAPAPPTNEPKPTSQQQQPTDKKKP